MPQSLKITLRKIYAYRALDDFVLLYPFYTIFMAAKGLSLLQISSLLVIWSLTDLLFNVPTGVLADKYSRRLLLCLAQLAKAAGFVTWFFFPHYVGFAIGFVLWGSGGVLEDGTFEAVVFDELKTAGQQNRYIRVMGKARSWGLTGNLAATMIAGVAIILGYGFVFGASIIVTIVSAFVALSLPKTARLETVADTRYFSMLKQGVLETIHDRTTLSIILLGGFIGAVYGSLEEFESLLARQAGVALPLIPIVVAASVAAAAIASVIAYKWEKLGTKTFTIFLAATGLVLMGAGLLANLGAIPLLVAYTFFIKLLDVIFDGKLQHSIAGGLRATITSVRGFTLEVMSIAVYLAYGLIAQRGNNFAAIKALGAVVALVALTYLLLGRQVLSKAALQRIGENKND